LRALSGAIPSTIYASVTGDIELCGHNIGVYSPSSTAKALGVVAQDPWAAICLPLDEDDIAFALENLAVAGAEIGPRVEAIASKTGITRLLNFPVAQLSGGQLQKVALAGALVTRPRVLLLDEPTSMLDHAGVTQVAQTLGKLASFTGESSAMIMVEHRLDELSELTKDTNGFGLPTRWIVLAADGSILWEGSPDTITADVAQLLWRHGCWLPLEIELLGRFGRAGGLNCPEIVDEINSAVHPSMIRSVRTKHVDSSEAAHPHAGSGSQARAVLTVHDLAVVPRALKGWGGNSQTPAQPLLTNVTFEVHTGELVALVGANGSGKTTLIRALAGVDRPIHGTISSGRQGLVFQNPEHQFMTSTVMEEMLYNLPVSQTSKARSLLAEFGLAGLDNRSPFSLSGGQKRRLSLATMMMHDPEILCADEPTYGLDRLASNCVMRALQTYSASGQGVVFSSHDLRTIASYASRVLVIANGTLRADVNVLELAQNPELLEAAQLHAPHIVHWLARHCETPEELKNKLQYLNDPYRDPAENRASTEWNVSSKHRGADYPRFPTGQHNASRSDLPAGSSGSKHGSRPPLLVRPKIT